jgi:hypothetical protein
MHDRWGRHSVPVAAPLLFAAATVLAACGSPTPTTPVDSTTGPTTPPITAIPATLAPATLPPVSVAPPTAAAGTAPCTASDLKASHGLVEGAAGSRLTEVVLVASSACSVDRFPTVGIRDSGDKAVVGGTAGGTGRIDLSPVGSYTSQVRLANWCAPDPAFPLTLELRLGAEELAVTGSSFPEDGNLPPCVGDGGPILEAGAWTPGS